MISLLVALACTHACILTWDAVPEAVSYEVIVTDTQEVCREVATNELDVRGTACDRDGAYQLEVRAIGADGQRSSNPSNAVWFYRACLEHTGETIGHGAHTERVGCERECCAGCVRELLARYEACPDE